MRFLICWVMVYLIFFSASATKLPNYTLPLYPALAILTADFLVRWVRREIRPPVWLIGYCVSWMFVIGLGIGVGFPIAAKRFEGIDQWAWLGAIPIAGGLAFVVLAAQGRRVSALAVLSGTAAALVGGVMGFAPLAVDEYKVATRATAESGAMRRDCDVRLASYQYTQPSLVILQSTRSGAQLLSDQQVREFLEFPIRSYLFVPEPRWRELQQSGVVEGEVVARHFDFYRNCDVLVVSNRQAIATMRPSVRDR